MRNADMMTPNADAPAHPIHELAGDPAFHGLTKREYFAAMAMQGLIANGRDNETLDDLAEESVVAADALLAELEKTS